MKLKLPDALAVCNGKMQGSNLNEVFLAQLQKIDQKLHIMKIAMQKCLKIKCCGHTGIFHSPHYISLGVFLDLCKELYYEVFLFSVIFMSVEAGSLKPPSFLFSVHQV